MVATEQRFTASHACPICGGHAQLPPGHGDRCWGFLSNDGEYAHCTREEQAGGLTMGADETYAHRLQGECRCGASHGTTERRNGQAEAPKRRIVETYDYRRADRTLDFQVARWDPKGFSQRRPDGQGGWEWKAGNLDLPYRLPELLEANSDALVFVPEGERDVDRLWSLGFTATCNPAGAKKWRPSHGAHLRGRHVVILPDADEVGREHAAMVVQSVDGIAATVRVLELPGLAEKGDVSDWLDAGHTAEELLTLAESAPLGPFWIAGFARLPIGANPANPEKVAPETFRLASLTDLLAEPAEEIPYVVDDLLPAGGISILGAKPKVGKSTLAREMAFCVARGEPFLGRVTSPGTVIYLALEEKRAEVQRQFARMGATVEPIFIHVGSAPEQAVPALTSAVAEHRPVLVIIDPLFRLVRVSDANDYAVVTKALEPLLNVARLSGTHVLLVHHMGKGERSGGDALLGSTAIFGAVDAALMMRKRDDLRIIESSQRYGTNLPETIVALDAETGRVSAKGTLSDAELQECAAKVLDVMGEEELTEKELKERIGGNQTLVSKAIRFLFEAEKVTRNGEGKKGNPFTYRARMTPPPRDPVNPENRANPANPESAECAVCGRLLQEGEGEICASCDAFAGVGR